MKRDVIIQLFNTHFRQVAINARFRPSLNWLASNPAARLTGTVDSVIELIIVRLQSNLRGPCGL